MRAYAHHATLIVVLLTGLALCGLSVPAAAQYRDDDARDRLVFKDGDEIEGRLLWQWDPEGKVHWLTPRGKRRKFDREDVLELDTVSSRLAGWLAARTPRASLDEEWALVELAVDAELDAMARAQALHLLSRDPSNRRAHEFLGHEERGGKWLWRFGDERKLLPFEDWEERGRDTGHPHIYEGEHFVLYSTADMGRAIDLLFDLERAYHEFHLEFRGVGSLRPRELVRRRLTVWVHRDVERFPKLTGAALGYYLPGLALIPGEETPFSGDGNEVQTYYEGTGTHPNNFFKIISQALLYNCVLADAATIWDSSSWGLYRENASMEVGFGNWFGSQFQGLPGYVSRRQFALDPVDAALARATRDLHVTVRRRNGLPNLIGLNYEFFHRNEPEIRDVLSARAHAFVAYLMDPRTTLPKGRKEGQFARNAFVEYLRDVYLAGSGASSSKFDDALGTKIEDLEEPFAEWLEQF